MSLTSEQVEGLAPDAGAAKNGRALAFARKWVAFGRQGDALWGLCQGSGSQPYQVRIDLSAPAYKCSCPSHKIPCKHSLGLMFLYADSPALFAAESACDFLSEWLDDRRQREQQKAQKREEAAGTAQADPARAVRREAAQAKRAASREDKVGGGMAELALFLKDLVREGIAGLPAKPYALWDGMARRLIDAQAPNLSRLVAELGSVCGSGAGWQERVVHRLSRLHLACEAWGRLVTLPEAAQADVRAFIGFPVSQDALLSSAGVSDTWYALAQRVTEEERLRVARTWLWSDGGKPAVLLHFAFAGQPLEARPAPPSAKRAEVVYYPGSVPQRAVLKPSAEEAPFRRPAGLAETEALLADFAARLALNPWLEQSPYLLDAVVPVCREGQWFLRDPAVSSQTRALPVAAGCSALWRLCAVSGGRPVAVFGEWDGESFEPLSVFDTSDRLVSLGEGGPA